MSTNKLIDWGSTCLDFKIKVSETVEKGRCVLANTHKLPGDRLLKTKAILWQVNFQRAQTMKRCHYCLSERIINNNEVKIECLGNCGSLYCTKECLNEDNSMNHHSIICKFIPLLSKKYRNANLDDWDITTAFLALKTIFKTITIDVNPRPLMGPSRDIEAISSLKETLSLTELLAWDEESASGGKTKFEIFWSSISPVFGNDDTNDNTRDIKNKVHKLLRRIQSNNFVICDNLDFGVAQGCFPFASLVNHDCDMNAIPIFTLKRRTPPELSIIANRHINTNSEICISYCDRIIPPKERNKKLKLLYGFQCNEDCFYCHPRPIDYDKGLARYYKFCTNKTDLMTSPLHQSLKFDALQWKTYLVNPKWFNVESYKYLCVIFDKMVFEETINWSISDIKKLSNSCWISCGRPNWCEVVNALPDNLEMSQSRVAGSYLIGRLLLYLQSEVVYVKSMGQHKLWHPVSLTQCISTADCGRELFKAIRDFSRDNWLICRIRQDVIELYEDCIKSLNLLRANDGPLSKFIEHCEIAKVTLQ